jgi:O-acetyl-ADP-ribose deacetylase
VDGAIHQAGGPRILAECRKIRAQHGGCATGEAVITTAGNLPAKYVIHTVGPVWNGGNRGEPDQLANCYKNSLRLAKENGAQTVAFPAISTGIYGYPKKAAAKIAWETVNNHPDKDFFAEVIFVFFSEGDKEVFEKAVEELSRSAG